MAAGNLSDTNSQITNRDRIDILLEEYRSLNVLLVFRLTAMDRRLPVSAGVFAAMLATIAALPFESRVAFLVAAPLAVVWLVRTTVAHACAKEDHLRRIDEIERLINTLAGQELLVFQSRHPNRRLTPAGRTGQSTVLAMSISGFVMLGLCVFLFVQHVTSLAKWPYVAYVAVAAVDVALRTMSLGQYRYRKASPTSPDILIEP